MERRTKILILGIVSLIILVSIGIGLFFGLKKPNLTICEEINSKFGLNNNNKYIFKDPNINAEVPFSICCPNSCEFSCGYSSKPDNKCLWKQEISNTGSYEITLPKYKCNEILKDKSKVGNVCYLE